MRPENLGIWKSVDWPLAGPGKDASGAGTGTGGPAGQAWKVPLRSAQPCWPVARLVPRTQMYTCSPRPDRLVNWSLIVAGTAAWAAGGSAATATPAATTPAARADRVR